MSIEGLIGSIIIFTLVIIFTAFPLFRAGDQIQSQEEILLAKQHERISLYYERALRNIRDLDEDHALGKISDAEHAADREIWVGRGVQALKALDLLKEKHLIVQLGDTHSSTDSYIDQAVSEAIEAAVARERAAV